MLGILKNHGKEVNYIYTNPKYYFDFNRLIKNEPNKQNRVKYALLLWGQLWIIPIYLIGMYYLL